MIDVCVCVCNYVSKQLTVTKTNSIYKPADLCVNNDGVTVRIQFYDDIKSWCCLELIAILLSYFID